MAESGEAPVKRGRGRPKGSLNRKTIERLASSPQRSGAEQASVPFALDVDFESNEILGEEAAAPQQSVEGGVEETPTPKPKRVRSVRITAPTAARRPPAKSSEPPNYLDVLKQGLVAAKAQHKAERVARYDAFFSH